MTDYSVCRQLKVNFIPLEDRLLVRAENDCRSLSMLLTRRMVILILQQLLTRLPEMSGLEKTPAAYWQDVLQMGHQHAMESKTRTDNATVSKKAADKGAGESDKDILPTESTSLANLFLATELIVQLNAQELTLAFRGLPMPGAMTEPSQHVPIFAIPLLVDNVHQLIELLTTKSHHAQWHLPLDLPWMAPADHDAHDKPLSFKPH